MTHPFKLATRNATLYIVRCILPLSSATRKTMKIFVIKTKISFVHVMSQSQYNGIACEAETKFFIIIEQSKLKHGRIFWRNQMQKRKLIQLYEL